MSPVDVEGLANVRGLGNLEREDGTLTPEGVFFRSEKLDNVTELGWQRLRDLGVRTVIDLRHPHERSGNVPPDFDRLLVDLDGTDRAFWDDFESDGRWCTPLYYAPHLEQQPELMASVLDAITRARPGALLFHCVAGWDRTGFVAATLLKAVGVTSRAATGDYLESCQNAEAVAQLHNRPSEMEGRLKVLQRNGHTPASAFENAYEAIDVQRLLDATNASEETRNAIWSWRGSLGV